MPGRRIFTDAELMAMYQKHLAGVSVRDIAIEANIEATALRVRWWRFLGVRPVRLPSVPKPAGRKRSISEEESRITAEKRNRGVPMRVICAEHHRTHATLHGAWKRDGIKIRRYNPGRTNEK